MCIRDRIDTKPPLLREHRLYQADWLLRFYEFTASEILDEKNPNFNPFIDPKCNWALNHMGNFPLEVNRASYEELLRVPGIGVQSARRILIARRTASVSYTHLKRLPGAQPEDHGRRGQKRNMEAYH